MTLFDPFESKNDYVAVSTSASSVSPSMGQQKGGWERDIFVFVNMITAHVTTLFAFFQEVLESIDSELLMGTMVQAYKDRHVSSSWCTQLAR